ncbi:MAG: Rrf2 family transcriptional regulator, partial [Armatimonadetes bacterium]|nr:Rrf2 family transcriptional regulator [Armatimonadota bacterium]
GNAVPNAEPAPATRVAPTSLEASLQRLRPAGILQRPRGKPGGYLLLRPASDVTVADIVMALEGDSTASARESDETVQSPYQSVTDRTFQQAAHAWWSHLASIRLSELAVQARQEMEERAGADMFHI